jgi:predicted dehydrogenase
LQGGPARGDLRERPEEARAAAEKFSSAAKFEHWREMIASKTIDAVLIATPHYQHPDIAVAAFDAGLHVLCEKPAAVTVKEARRMNDAAAAPEPEVRDELSDARQPAAAKAFAS